MSFVGPRPERPFFVQQFAKEIPYYTQRLSVKPGITGWAQVNYPYGATQEDAVEKLRLDLYYIKNMSLLLDLFIVLQTAKIALLGQGAR
jgi:lipopolysaccharide/colanic/teichoic acid biosynthesis glycosyltransferase